MESVLRMVRRVTHFDPKPERELQRIEAEDPRLGASLRARGVARPFGHDVLDLKCGHTVVKVRAKKNVLWLRIPCEQCSRREVEMTARYATGERRREERQDAMAEALAQGADDPMAKSKSTKTVKTSTKKAGRSEGREWKQSYAFLKELKLVPVKESVKGAIYNAIKKVKSGTATEIADAAVASFGLKEYTKQDPRTMTQSLLRQFAELGAVAIKKDASEAPAAKGAKAPVAKAKAPKAKGGGKRVVLKRAAPAPEAAPATA